MKTTITLLTGLALASSAYAGEDYSAKGAKEIVAPPPAPCLWTWFAGGSVGRVDGDWDEEIYTLHFGAERKCPGSNCSHAFYLEIGYTEKDDRAEREDGSPDLAGYLNLTLGQDLRLDAEAEIIPITLNYKYECAINDKLNWFVGAGAGIALVDLKFSTSVNSVSYDDTTFYAHLFAGVTYDINESVELYLGARYIIMDDPSLTGISMFDNVVSTDGDIHYDLGVRVNF